jgi:hypothetical protein
MDLESVLSFLADGGPEGLDASFLSGESAGGMLAMLQHAGIDLSSLSEAELNVLLEAFPELDGSTLVASTMSGDPGSSTPEVRFGSGREWEYWGDGTYWERGPDGSYTGRSSGW